MAVFYANHDLLYKLEIAFYFLDHFILRASHSFAIAVWSRALPDALTFSLVALHNAERHIIWLSSKDGVPPLKCKGT
jgi:hypothetical protein